MISAIGYDCHRLKYKRKGNVRIAGIDIPCNRRIVAHSDGDVVIHAIVDALSSNILHKSIGDLFSDRDPKNKKRNSEEFLEELLKLTGKIKIGNIDIIVIVEKPIITDYTQKMREKISKLLDIPIENINIRGKRREDRIKKISAILTLNIN